MVGTLGSAAAASKFFGLSVTECQEALAIAVSHAGAPMANAATQTKPLHVGNAARHGLEAAFLAMLGLQGNKRVLDLDYFFEFTKASFMAQDAAVRCKMSLWLDSSSCHHFLGGLTFNSSLLHPCLRPANSQRKTQLPVPSFF